MWNTTNILDCVSHTDLIPPQFSDRAVSMAAVDMLSMLVEVAPCILSLYHSLPARILQALCYAIAGECI